MHDFKVSDMTCSHCVATVEKAVRGADSSAKVNIDLASHAVRIDSQKPASIFAKAIGEAGYTGQLRG